MTDQSCPQYYYQSKSEAITAGAEIAAQDDRIASVSVSLEPNNGWVVTLVPKLIDLSDLGDRFEVRTPDGRRLSPLPEGRKPVAEPRKTGAPVGSAPRKGSTARVWEVADRVYGEKGLDRAAIIAACEAEGINKATAGTQYAKWRRERGY